MNMKTTLMVIFYAGSAALLGSAIAYADAPSLPRQELPVPEPATIALLGAGLVGLAAYKFIRKHKK